MRTRQMVRLFACGRDVPSVLCPVLAALLIVGPVSPALPAPEGGIVRGGNAQITGQGSTTVIQQSSERAIIDWRSFGITANEQVRFDQPSVSSATLNRVTGGQVSLLLGRLDANGQVLLVNPNGIIFGKGVQINVGSLIATTANINNENFLKGNLVFDQPGRPGAGIINAGNITAADGGLVALVAPSVRNDGLIQARLGRVFLGAAETFTLDLYGDGLVNLALSNESLARLQDAQGQPVASLISQRGTIDVGAGQAVLVTAEAARGVLDSLISMSGAILADSAVQEGGRIMLLARGGTTEVSGTLSARGATGGQIDVLGGEVHLLSNATLDAGGAYGGGSLHVGGAYQGGGDTYRAQRTQIDAGATLQAGAQSRGNGGDVVVWSDDETSYAGSIQTRGGTEGGDGGRVEVSGKRTLFFNGLVDAGAPAGTAGSLLLDPYDFTIGMAEASLIDRVLRTGTSTAVSADNNLTVDYVIDGRGRNAGGGLTLSAGNNIRVNDDIITNNGAINLFAGAGTVSVASGQAVFAGSAPITVRSGGNLTNAPYLTGGLLSLVSTQGSVNIAQGIDSTIGDLLVQAVGDVNINQPIVSHSDGNAVTVSAGNDIKVNAQIDGRPAAAIDPQGTVTMTAGRNIDLNNSILANGISLTASLGTIHAPTMKDGTITVDANGIPQGNGLFAGTGPISVTAGGDLSSGLYVTTGPVALRSTGGNVNVDTKLAEVLGNVTIAADAGSINVDQAIASIRSGGNLTMTAGSNVNVNRQIDALDDANPLSLTPVPGGGVAITAGNNVNLNSDLITYNGPVTITADLAGTAGTLNIAWNGTEDRTFRIQTGSGPITVTTGGDLAAGTAPPATLPWDPAWVAGMTPQQARDFAYSYIADQLSRYVAFSTTGKLSLSSIGGDVTINAPVSDATGEVAIDAADAIVVNHKVMSNNQPITLTAGAGGIWVNPTNDCYGISSCGAGYAPALASGNGDLTLRSGGDISISAGNGIATGGKLTIDTRGHILQGFVHQFWGNRPSEISLTADQGIDSFNAGYSPTVSAASLNGDIHLAAYGPGQLSIEATQGSVFTGGSLGNAVDIHAGLDINLNQVFPSGTVRLTAGRDANMSVIDAYSLDVTAANNITFSNSLVPAPVATVWLNGGNLTATSTGGNISFTDYSAVHIEAGGGLTLTAHGSVQMGILETLGPVSMTAQTGNITLRNSIGPPIPVFDPTGIGVASLLLNAGGNINMQGAKAAGVVTITSGGFLVPSRGIFSGTSNGVSITAVSGAAEPKLIGPPIIHMGRYMFTGTSFGDIPLESQAQLSRPGSIVPVVSQGPSVAAPGLPLALTALPAQLPDMVAVSGHDIPAAAPDWEGWTHQVDPARASGMGILSEIATVQEEGAVEEEDRTVLNVPSGRGIGRTADLGRR